MTPQEIKEILEKSGYLFEQRAASIIESLGYLTTTNRAYHDNEENKSREMDVVAEKTIFTMEGKKTIAGICYLNCECKNSTTPYVFIERKRGYLDRWNPDGIYLVHDEYFKQIDERKRQILNAFYYMELQKEHFATRGEEHAVQICKILQNGSKKEAQHSGVIESFIYPLVKSKKVWESQALINNETYTFCKFFFNLVIVNSKLYTINPEESDSLPEEEGFVPFVREIQNKHFQGKFLITFVNYNFLKEFIKSSVESFCLKVRDKYLERPDLLLNTALQDL